jgi:N-hydroxyarylamine O-acetyltransferase
MDISEYLKRINVITEVKPDLKTLKLLHQNHLLNIPFENLDIHSGRKIILEKDRLLNKIVNEERGGFCYELNGAFYELLISIGFKVKRISAGVANKDGVFGPGFDHMALIVILDDEEWLADVGFGDSFVLPLKFTMDEVQKDVWDFFKIIIAEEENYFILLSSVDGKDFIPQYKFSLKPRELKEYQQMCDYHQASPKSHFTQKVICSKATETGRISLSDLKLIITENGVKSEKEINEKEFNQLLQMEFNMILNRKFAFPNNVNVKS